MSNLVGRRTITSEGRPVADVQVYELEQAEERTIQKRVAGVPDPTLHTTARYRAEADTPDGISFSQLGEDPGDAVSRLADAILADVAATRRVLYALNAYVKGESDF